MWEDESGPGIYGRLIVNGQDEGGLRCFFDLLDLTLPFGTLKSSGILVQRPGIEKRRLSDSWGGVLPVSTLTIPDSGAWLALLQPNLPKLCLQAGN
jgi:hypothetical protein